MFSCLNKECCSSSQYNLHDRMLRLDANATLNKSSISIHSSVTLFNHNLHNFTQTNIQQVFQYIAIPIKITANHTFLYPQPPSLSKFITMPSFYGRRLWTCRHIVIKNQCHLEPGFVKFQNFILADYKIEYSKMLIDWTSDSSARFEK